MKAAPSNKPKLDPRVKGADCDNCCLKDLTPVPPQVVARPLLAVIVDSPGETEVIHRKPLVGNAGQLFDKVLEVEGISRGRLHITHAIMCRPKRNMTPAEWRNAMTCCRPRLEKELVGIKHVAALGPKAQETISGKAKHRDWMGPPSQGIVWKPNGKKWKPLVRQPEPPDDSIRFDDKEWISTFHPAECKANPALAPVFRKHIRRVYQRSIGTLADWKWPREVIDQGGELEPALIELLRADHVAVDTETSGLDPYTAELFDIGISNSSVSVSVFWPTASSTIRTLVRQILASKFITKSFWNMQYDLLVFRYNGIQVGGKCEDWMLAHMLFAPRLSHKLTDASCYEFHVPRWKTEFHKQSDDPGSERFQRADPAVRALYNARDTYVTHLLAAPFAGYLKKHHRGEELYQNALDNSHIAMKMRMRGIKLDRDALGAKRLEAASKYEDAKRALKDVCASIGVDDFNPASAPQRKALFQQTLKVQIPMRKGKQSLDENALLDFLIHPDPNVRLVSQSMLGVRKAKKKIDVLRFANPKKGLNFLRESTFTVHSNWRPGKAKTGRWASGDPQMMNFPKVGKGDSEGGMRDIFIAREGNVFVEVDYSALEGRILALLSGDKTLLEWFATDVDLHNRTAGLALGKTDDQVDKNTEREIMKSVRYAFHYNAAPETAWKAAVIKVPSFTLRQAEKLFALLTRLHPDIVRYHEESLQTATELDYIEDPLSGRRYYFHGQVDAAQVYNLPIQMCASGLIDAAMRRLNPRLNDGEDIILQVHDSLLCEGPDPDRLISLIKEEMERPITLNGKSISFAVDVKVGTCWGKMKSVKC